VATASFDDLDNSEKAPVTTGFFVALWRHKALLFFGLAVGLGIGFAYYLNKAPTYQSTAQIVVFKRRADMNPMGGGGASLQGFVEDYVATQESLIQSQLIWTRAAKKLEGQPLSENWTQEQLVALIGASLKVSRNKDATSGMNQNVLNISIRGSNPDDCKKIVDAIIEGYNESVSGALGSVTDDNLKLINTSLETTQREFAEVEAEMKKKNSEIEKLNPVALTDIKARINNNENKLTEHRAQNRDMDSNLDLIQKTISSGGDRTALEIMYRLMQPGQRQQAMPGEAPRTPQEFVFNITLQEVELSQRLGPGHPDMVALKLRKEMIVDHLTKLQARDATAQEPKAEKQQTQDLLAMYRDVLKAQKTANDYKITDLEKILVSDRESVKKLEIHAGQLTLLKDQYDSLRRQLMNLRERKQQNDISRDARLFDVQTITPSTAGIKVSPLLPTTLGLAGILGLLLGSGLAYLAEATDRSFRSIQEVRQRLGLTVFGQIPPLTAFEPTVITDNPLDANLVVHHAPKSVQAEAYRGVRTSLYFSTRGKGHQVIQVTSPNPGDGKSTLISNLACAIAQSGRKVILIDADFRKPRVHKIFGLGYAEVGLASVIAGEAELESAIYSCDVPGLSILPCGPRPANPADLLTSVLFSDILNEIKKDYEFVLIDTPPILAVSDPAVVAPRVDGVILTIRMTKNSRPLAEQAKERLTLLGANVLGVVVNSTEDMAKGGYGYGYSYQYAYGDDEEDESPIAEPIEEATTLTRTR